MTLEAEPVSPGKALSGKLSGKLSYALRRGILLRQENPTYWAPVAAATRGFIYREPWQQLCRGTCAPLSALLVCMYANLLSVTRCNISFGARGFRSAAPAIWNSLPSNARSCETLTTFRRHLKSHLFHSAFTSA